MTVGKLAEIHEIKTGLPKLRRIS